MQPSFDPFDNALKRRLREGRNLLAFSAGIDSSALFFLLLEADIPFDIAIMEYDRRPEAKEEVSHAHTLARRYNKRCFHRAVSLQGANFEHEARRMRYAFFEELIHRHHYDHLLTAHQLDDRAEWFLMQWCKGAGAVELAGFAPIEERSGYTLIRPLAQIPRATLLAYLERNDLPYYLDRSNEAYTHTRNLFRHRFVRPLMERYAEGIARSMRYVQEDADTLFSPGIVAQTHELAIVHRAQSRTLSMRRIDRRLKALGYLSSLAQREEMLRQKEGIVGGRIAFALSDTLIWIAPYCDATMPKTFKEACRKAHIPAKIRPYLFKKGIDPSKLRYHVDNKKNE